MSRVMKNSKGYSFVELIIVIAIIVVLSVMALVSMTIISSAKAKDAAITVGEEISILKQRSMNMTPDDIDTSTGKPLGNYDKYAIALYLTSDDKIACCLVKHVDPNTSASSLSGVKGMYVPVEYDGSSFTSTDFGDSENNITFSKRIDVEFTGKFKVNTTTGYSPDNNCNEYRPDIQRDYFTGLGGVNYPIYITFDKRGNCTSGYGNYYFYKRNGNHVARIEVLKNGSITIK